MSEASELNEKDDHSILEVEDNEEENIKLGEEDEMLLLSSPEQAKVEEAVFSLEQKDKLEKKQKVTKKDGILNSSGKIVVEDSESEDEFENTDNSVEVIDSGDDEILEEDEEEEEEDVENVESSSAYLDGKVQIFHLHGSLFVWNAEDVRMLREECRIIGKLSGCLPRAPRQNNQLGLPLQLMPEEAKLLEEIDAACVVEEAEVDDEDEKLRRTAFEQTRVENFKIQQKLYKESRKVEITQNMDKIVAGKKAKKRKLKELAKSKKVSKLDSDTSNTGVNVSDVKGQDDAKEGGDARKKEKDDGTEKEEKDDVAGKEEKDDDAEKEEKDDGAGKEEKDDGAGKEEKDDGAGREQKDENNIVESGGPEKEENADDSSDDSSVDEIPDVDEMVSSETDAKHSFVQIFTDNPWHRDVKRCQNWVFPMCQRDLLRFAVFRDLWGKGYFLTSGTKFGGDYLVYPGDPARYHSHYIAICVDISEDMSMLDLVSMARLASNVRKTALICSFNKFRQVSYFSTQWTGMV